MSNENTSPLRSGVFDGDVQFVEVQGLADKVVGPQA